MGLGPKFILPVLQFLTWMKGKEAAKFAMEKGFFVFKKGLELAIAAIRIAAAWLGAFAIYAAIGLLVIGIIALFAVFIYLMRDQIVAVISKIIDFFGKILDFVSNALTSIISGVMSIINTIGNVIMSVANSIGTIVNAIGGFFKSLFDLISGVILGIASSLFGNLFNKKDNTKLSNYETAVIDHLDSILSCLIPNNDKKEAITDENKTKINPETNVNIINKNNNIAGIASSVLHIEEYLKIISENSVIKTISQKINPFLSTNTIKNNKIETNTIATDTSINNIHQGANQIGGDSSLVVDILKESNNIATKILNKLESFNQNKKINFPTINF
jgi:hypothetical protein